jgi:hypothetical protein
MGKHFVFFSLLMLSISLIGNAQNDTLHFLKPLIFEGDTLPMHNIEEIKVYSPKVFKNRRHKRRYSRLVRNVKKAYPFAIIARHELKAMNDSLRFIHGDRERKLFIKEYEKDMFRHYEADLRKLTISQGRILLKLVDREFGNTSFELVQEYRGNFSAVFWQGIARIFGSNLKSHYDPEGEDAEIEEIVELIEAGLI